MAVTYDSVGPSASGVGGTANPLSWTHTTVAASTIVLVAISCDITSTGAFAGVNCTLDGSNMTEIDGGSANPTGASGANKHNEVIRVWYKTGITAGAHTISYTDPGTISDFEGGSIAFAGAASVGTPVGNGTTTATVNGTAADSMVAGFAGAGNNITAQSGTSRFLNNYYGVSGDYLGNVAGQTTAGGGNITLSFTTSASANAQAMIAVEIIAIPTGSESSTVYSASASALSGGTGSWANTGNANGAPDTVSAVWTSV